MGISFGEGLLHFTGGVAKGVAETDAAESKRIERLAEIKAKRQDELLKTKLTAANKKYDAAEVKIESITSAGGIDTPQGQVIAGGYKDLAGLETARKMAGSSWIPANMPVLGEKPTLKYSNEEGIYTSMRAETPTGMRGLMNDLGFTDPKEKIPLTEEDLGSVTTYRRGKSTPLTEEQKATMSKWEFPSDKNKKSNKKLIAEELTSEYTTNLSNYPQLAAHIATVPIEDREGVIQAFATSVAYTQDVSSGMPYDKLQQALFNAQRNIQEGNSSTVVPASVTTPESVSVTTPESVGDPVAVSSSGTQLSVLEGDVLRLQELMMHPDLKIATNAKSTLVKAQKKLTTFQDELAKNVVKISNKTKAFDTARSRDENKDINTITLSASKALGDGDYFYRKTGTKGKKVYTPTELGRNYHDALKQAINQASTQVREDARSDEVLDIKKLDAIDWTNVTNIAKKDLASRTFEFDTGLTANSAYVIPYNVVPFGTAVTDDMRIQYESGLLRYVKEIGGTVLKDASLGDISANYYTLQTQGADVLTPLSDTSSTIVPEVTPTGDLQLMSDGTATPPQVTPVDMNVQFTVKDGVKGILGTSSTGTVRFLPFTEKNKVKYESLGLGYLYTEEVEDVPRMNGDPRDNEWATQPADTTTIEDVSSWLGDVSDEVMRALPGLPGGSAAKLPSIISTYLRTGQVSSQLGVAGEKLGMLLDKLKITKHPMAQQIVNGKFGKKYGSRKAQIADKLKTSTTGKVVDATLNRGKANVSSSTNRLKQRAVNKTRAAKNAVKNAGDSILNSTTGTTKGGYPINNPAASRLQQYTDKTSKIK